ncbi:MAG: c-type cytochrome [Candidatus Eisenbacteria bacterium]|nr:c-type cytochrome [Candidatus Eisenbacteria bacterium]
MSFRRRSRSRSCSRSHSCAHSPYRFRLRSFARLPLALLLAIAASLTIRAAGAADPAPPSAARAPGSAPAGASAPAPAPRQEEPMKNLQVFPKDTPRAEVLQAMRSFTQALGVRCDHCHVDEHGGPNPREDMASDEKLPKRQAREMLRMTQRINADLLTALPQRHDPPVAVRCVTCHRGLPVPETLADRLGSVLEKAGLDSALATYRSLRADPFHGWFDLSESSLAGFARQLSSAGKNDEALAFLELDREFYPESRMLPLAVADVYVAKGDRAAALAELERLVAADPGNMRAAQRLNELKEAKEPK